MFVCFAFEDDEREQIDVWDEGIRGPFPTLAQALKAVEVIKADCGNDTPLEEFEQKVYLNGQGPHSAGRVRIDFRELGGMLTLRIVEMV